MTHHSLALRVALARPTIKLGGPGIAAVLVTAHVTNDALTSLLSALLPTLQARLALSDTTLALLVAALALSASVTQPLMGAVSDRIGPRRAAAAGTAFGVSTLSLITVAPSAAVLFALLLLGGLGSAVFHPAATSLFSTVPLRRRELSVGMFSAGGTVGLAVGPLIVLAAVGTVGLGITPWLIVPALALGAVMYWLVPDPERPPNHAPAQISDAGLFRGPVARLAAAATMANLAFVAFTASYPLYLVRAHGVAPSDPLIGLTLGIFNLGAAGGAVAAGVLAARVDRRALVGGSLVGSLVPLALLLSSRPGGPVYIAAVAAAGALLNTNLPVLLVAAHRLVPNSPAAASGMLMGLPIGLAGILYVGVAHLQGIVGVTPAMAAAFASVVPAAALAFHALRADGPGKPASPAACPCPVPPARALPAGTT
jgi:FSR family fosmidomycin resistance protein-like MFS transporter